MLRIWQKLRILLLLIAFLILGLYLFTFTPWQHFLGLTPDYQPRLTQGQPIVNALYQYHADTNLWPEYLDDLSPTYLPKPLDPHWFYELTSTGPALSINIDSHTHLAFNFDPANPQWLIFGSSDNRTLQSLANSPTTHPASPNSAQLLTNELTELDRRIAREKTNLDHRRAKTQLLHTLHRDTPALTAIDQTRLDNPNSYWPLYARAMLQPTPQNLTDLATWTAANPSFTAYARLSFACQIANQKDNATRAIDSALQEPLQLNPDDPDILPAYFWNLALWSLHEKQFPLLLKICAAWQTSQQNLPHPESSYLAFRAAAQLAQGNFAAALDSLNALTVYKNPHFAQNLDTLRTAIETHNTGFTYTPGPYRGERIIFP